MKSEHIDSSLIGLYKSLFKGREDVFAIRWEKGNKSGYMPAYQYDPYMFRLHKKNGGTFKNYKDKTYLPLTDEAILKHIRGESFIGIYPLCKDNTSHFLVADFDKDNWLDECLAFINTCEEHDISAYLERSRSGKGGHVWVFFEKAYPASKSRKIFRSLLEKTGSFSFLHKSSSFDRLFPNQDYLSGKGLGNLIALPLNDKLVAQGNNCFISLDTLQPFDDQWGFLSSIKRTPIKILEEFLPNLSNSHRANIALPTSEITPRELEIKLGAQIEIGKAGIPELLVEFLRDELNFFNKEFAVKKNMGKSTWDVGRYFRFYEETDQVFLLPRGIIGRLLRFCMKHKLQYKFIDQRQKSDIVEFSFQTQLRSYQEDVVHKIQKKDIGVVVAPPASGKTVIGLKLIAERKQPALIVVHRKHLLDQWVERIESFLGIPKKEIGKIGQGKAKLGKHVTIAMIQSLAKQLEKDEGRNQDDKGRD